MLFVDWRHLVCLRSSVFKKKKKVYAVSVRWSRSWLDRPLCPRSFSICWSWIQTRCGLTWPHWGSFWLLHWNLLCLQHLFTSFVLFLVRLLISFRIGEVSLNSQFTPQWRELGHRKVDMLPFPDAFFLQHIIQSAPTSLMPLKFTS